MWRSICPPGMDSFFYGIFQKVNDTYLVLLLIYFEIPVSALLAEHLLVFFLFCQWCFRFVVSCVPSWFWGPVVTLQDCLAAFFARDELKGKRLITWTCCFFFSNSDKNISIFFAFYSLQLSGSHLLAYNTVIPCSYGIIHFKKVSFLFNWMFCPELPVKADFRNIKWISIWCNKMVSTKGLYNFQKLLFNSHSQNLNFDMVNYFAFKFCRIISSDYSVLLSFMLLIIKNFSV